MSCQFGVMFTEPAKRTGGADKAPAERLEAWNGRELLHVGAVDSSGVTKLVSSATSLSMFFDNRLHIAHKQHSRVLIGNQRQFD
jgi:hypothetical protein